MKGADLTAPGATVKRGVASKVDTMDLVSLMRSSWAYEIGRY